MPEVFILPPNTYTFKLNVIEFAQIGMMKTQIAKMQTKPTPDSHFDEQI